METPLKILFLEDNPNDAELVKQTLAKEKFDCEITRVESREEFLTALDTGPLDLIFADYHLPHFDGMAALGFAREKRPEIPFIFVSGTIEEGLAIEALKLGATDYVFKHRLSRLVPAVRRALQEWENRKKRLEAEKLLREAEDALRQSQKMEAIGRLAGSVAHDFNNFMTVIEGYAELLTKKFPPGDANREAVDEILKAAESASRLTSQLLTFSRKQEVAPKILNLNELVRNIYRMIEHLLGADIKIETVLAESLDMVQADPNQLEQVLMNLLVNARDAIRRGGTITLETANVILSGNFTRRYPDIPPGRYVLISVADTGCGMTEEVKQHLFEPFFSTKEKGKGTGLGLATCYGIVKQAQGHIVVDSELKKGSTFRIYLPCAEKIGEAQPLTIEKEQELPRGHETILVVEDQPLVKELTVRVLRDQGYQVIAAGDGPEALRLVNEKDRSLRVPIDLLLTDVIMPEMTGNELAKCLKEICPGIKVLFTSGYDDEAIGHLGVIDPQVEFIQKPFTPKSLVLKVREVLDKRPAREERKAA